MGVPLQIGVLGPLEVRCEGRPVDLGGTRQRVVLARLALSVGRAIQPAVLLEALWGDDPPTNATANLRSYVSRLRAVIGRDRLRWTAGGYQLDVSADAVDLGRAERLAEQAGAAAGDPDTAIELLSGALELWRGEPLSDLPDTLPFAAELAGLHEWRLQLIERRCACLLDTGRGREAIPELARLVEAEPTRENLHLLLMRTLHQEGRTAEALTAGQRYRRRLAEDTGLDPGAQLGDLEQRLLAGDLPSPPAMRSTQRPGRLPVRPTPADLFVGRHTELRQVEALLRRHRVVTVTGPGGVGKTRLILEIVAAQPSVPTFFAELAGVAAPEDVAATVAASAGLQSAPAGLVAALADRIGAAETLLVLDNCEHVLDAVRTLTVELSGRCPALRVLATSRHRLDLPGEAVQRLGPLSEEDQEHLFRDRAGLLRADFDGSAADILGVCRLLDGLPLAVELAAHREAVFGLRELRERLTAGLQVLEPVGPPDRATALTATAEWSYRLLDPQARMLFDRLAVCQGGFVAGALDHLAPPGADKPEALLAELVEASMVLVDLSVVPPRYRILEPMRQVAAGHCDDDGRADAGDAHARWMQSFADDLEREQNARSPTVGAALRAELANLRQALTWLVEAALWERAAALAIPLVLAASDDIPLDLIGPLELFAQAPSSPPELAGTCVAVVGAARWLMGQAHGAEEPLDVALDLLPIAHPRRWVPLFFRAMSRMYSGHAAGVAADTTGLLENCGAPEWVQATSVCNTALIHLFGGDRAGGEKWMLRHEDLLALVGRGDGFVAYTRGEFAAGEHPEIALDFFDQAYRQCDSAGHTFNREVAAIGRAAVLVRLARWEQAVPACADGAERSRAAGMWPQLWTVLRLSAELLTEIGDPAPAASLLTAADTDPFAPHVLGPDADRQQRLWERIAAELPDAELARARAEGASVGRAGAAELAVLALRRHR